GDGGGIGDYAAAAGQRERRDLRHHGGRNRLCESDRLETRGRCAARGAAGIAATPGAREIAARGGGVARDRSSIDRSLGVARRPDGCFAELSLGAYGGSPTPQPSGSASS